MTSANLRDKRGPVNGARHLILKHRRWAAALIALALFAKLLVPAGFMLNNTAGSITVELCSGFGVKTIEMAIPGHPKPVKADSPCTFAGLGAPMLGGVDPILLALAIAFIMAIGFLAVPAMRPRATVWLRPPLRGPPVTA